MREYTVELLLTSRYRYKIRADNAQDAVDAANLNHAFKVQSDDSSLIHAHTRTLVDGEEFSDENFTV